MGLCPEKCLLKDEVSFIETLASETRPKRDNSWTSGVTKPVKRLAGSLDDLGSIRF